MPTRKFATSRRLRGATYTAALLTLAFAGACAPRISRIAPEQAIDLSGRWNDVDSRLVAEALIEQSFEPAGQQNWALRFAQQHGGARPTLIVGTVRNRSMEHVPVGTFVRDLERAYVGSGMVNVVASRAERDEIREERDDQQQFASATTRAALRQETGANYVLQGEIQSIEDSDGGDRVVYYQVDLTVTDLETNSRVWIGQHKIKKYIDRPRLRV